MEEYFDENGKYIFKDDQTFVHDGFVKADTEAEAIKSLKEHYNRLNEDVVKIVSIEKTSFGDNYSDTASKGKNNYWIDYIIKERG